jgi:hypothetical protein
MNRWRVEARYLMGLAWIPNKLVENAKQSLSGTSSLMLEVTEHKIIPPTYF